MEAKGGKKREKWIQVLLKNQSKGKSRREKKKSGKT